MGYIYTSSQIHHKLSNFSRTLLNKCGNLRRTLFASQCSLCGENAFESGLCDACRLSLLALEGPLCRHCAHPLPTGSVCGRCLADPPFYDRVYATCRYDYPVAELIQDFKFGSRLQHARPLSSLLKEQGHAPTDLVIPMPLSPARLRARGFNQALALALPLARAAGCPVDTALCIRQRETPPQSQLPWQARKKNIRGAFTVTRDIPSLRIMVVDDVLTTGATLNELARVLKKAGAMEVTGCVVARTVARG